LLLLFVSKEFFVSGSRSKLAIQIGRFECRCVQIEIDMAGYSGHRWQQVCGCCRLPREVGERTRRASRCRWGRWRLPIDLSCLRDPN